MARAASILRDKRRDLGMNLVEAAEGCGVSRATLQRLETASGKGLPHPSTALKVARYYGLKPSAVWISHEETINA
ncbi:MAG: helix-turn-helix transcriptional regulator [Solirubrobacteraceae bacterium]